MLKLSAIKRMLTTLSPLSVCLSLSLCQIICLYVCLPVCLISCLVSLSISVPVSLRIIAVCMSVSIFLLLSLPSACLSLCLPVCLPISVSVLSARARLSTVCVYDFYAINVRSARKQWSHYPSPLYIYLSKSRRWIFSVVCPSDYVCL